MMSIRLKLTIWLTCLVMFSSLVSLIYIESMLRQAFHDSIIDRLREDITQVEIATQISAKDISINAGELSSFYKPAYSGRYYQLNAGETEIRSRSLWDQHLSVMPLEAGKTRVWQAKGPKKHDIQLLSIGLPTLSPSGTVTLTVAQDLSIGRKVFREVYGTKLLGNLAMLAAMIIGIFIILHQSFKPIAGVKQALAKLRQGETNSLDISQMPAEIKPLAETYNGLLEYTGVQIQRSRNNLGNLSHGLKTPLAVMRQQVEVLALKDPQTAQLLDQQLQQIHNMIERKLAAARATGDMLPAAQMVLPRDIDSLSNTLQKVYHHKSIQLKFDLAAQITRLPIHREDGMELLGNLLDNAFKWATSQVLIRVWPQQGRIFISVEDDGSGVPEAQLDKLTRRGKRLDEEVAGHGLGLSIVKDIAEQYQFEINFDSSPALGGLRVTLSHA
ncbi:GHKL domain-containing protein [Shewanella avicenniae]|uniref:histidine kinase n=1 Tax=Shewanella avicenniae TaxID=2814294 RepID=A0ABX7QUL7_9GAMM|nr:ATP-binding protein [Shewanella avicenniae]QSX34355.1 GHKL domain-containing protein [Shewanella avicenniae]